MGDELEKKDNQKHRIREQYRKWKEIVDTESESTTGIREALIGFSTEPMKFVQGRGWI